MSRIEISRLLRCTVTDALHNGIVYELIRTAVRSPARARGNVSQASQIWLGQKASGDGKDLFVEFMHGIVYITVISRHTLLSVSYRSPSWIPAGRFSRSFRARPAMPWDGTQMKLYAGPSLGP
jgi:hypothetical protein